MNPAASPDPEGIASDPAPWLELAVTQHATYTYTCIEVAGALDTTTVRQLQAVIEDAHRDAAFVVIDLAALTFCDRVGLDMLVAQQSALRADGGALTIRHPSRVFRQLLAHHGLDHDLRAPATGPMPRIGGSADRV